MAEFFMSFGAAFWAFLIAYEMLPKLWQSIIAALVIFLLCLLAITNDINGLLYVIWIALPLLTIIIAIGKNS